MKIAVVGSWDFKKKNGGITVCSYNEENGHIDPIANYASEVRVGSTPAFDGVDTIYFINETTDIDYAPYGGGGGGYVYSAKIDPENGEFKVLNRVESLGSNPCYCAIDENREYLLVVHHTSSSHNITKIVRNDNGSLSTQIVYEDASAVLFELNKDGSIGKALDYHIHEQNGLRHTLLHSVYQYKNFFISSDKGQDRIYSYSIDKANKKLQLIDGLEVGKYTACRYLGFHPTLNRMYGTNEKKSYINVYTMDDKTGKLEMLGDEFIFEDSEYSRFNAKFATDCIVHPSGKYLYVALAAFTGEDRIVTMDLDESGMPVYRHYDINQGKSPKALQISSNGKYLYSCNAGSGNISIYEILKDGNLKFKENVEISNAANMIFI